MTNITIDVSEAVRKLDPKDMVQAITEAIDKSADLLREDMRVYPPPVPNSTYIRTGKLKAGWAKRMGATGGLPSAIIGNYGVTYAPYVQDYDRQAAIHRNRWQTTQMIAYKRKHDIKLLIEAVLARWAR